MQRELLDMSLAEDGTYTDPAYKVRDREELTGLIDRSLSGEAYNGAGTGTLLTAI